MVFNQRFAILAAGFLFIMGAHVTGASAGPGGPLPLPAVAAAAAAPVLPPKPMTVVRMRGKDRCGNRCPEWIMAEGIITPNTPERFRQLLSELGDEKLPVVLDSQGGDLDAALAIGRMIRSAGLTTVIGRSEVQGCAPRDAACNKGRPFGLPYNGFVTPRGSCSSTCLFVLAGGVERAGYWNGEARLPAPNSFKTRRAGGDADALIGTYFAEMGISPGLVARIRRSSLPLDRNDMLHFNLSTSRARVEDFTGTSLCVRAKPAPNCLMPSAVSAMGEDAPRVSTRRPTAQRPGQVIILGGIEDM